MRPKLQASNPTSNKYTCMWNGALLACSQFGRQIYNGINVILSASRTHFVFLARCKLVINALGPHRVVAEYECGSCVRAFAFESKTHTIVRSLGTRALSLSRSLSTINYTHATIVLVLLAARSMVIVTRNTHTHAPRRKSGCISSNHFIFYYYYSYTTHNMQENNLLLFGYGCTVSAWCCWCWRCFHSLLLSCVPFHSVM